MSNAPLRIDNVYFAYTQIAKPVLKHLSNIEKEYKATIILSEDQAYDFKARKFNKTVKEIKTEEFEAKYKFAPPYPDQKYQYFFSISKAATYKDGNLRPEWTAPRAFFVTDGKLIESTDTLIGNGSKGHVFIEVNYSEKLKTTNIALQSVAITEHVEYKAQGGGSEYADLGLEIVQDQARKERELANSSSSSRESSAPSSNVADLEDDLPF